MATGGCAEIRTKRGNDQDAESQNGPMSCGDRQDGEHSNAARHAKRRRETCRVEIGLIRLRGRAKRPRCRGLRDEQAGTQNTEGKEECTAFTQRKAENERTHERNRKNMTREEHDQEHEVENGDD